MADDLQLSLCMILYYISRKYILSVDNYTPNSTYKVQSRDFHFFHDTQKNHDLFQHKKSYDVPCVWLMYFDFTMTIQQVLTMFSNASLDFDDDFIIALNQNDGQVLLWELYKIGSLMPIQNINVGEWTTIDGLKFTKSHKWVRRSDLLGYNFKITSLIEAPYTTSIELESRTAKHNLEGSFVDLLNLFSETLNFTYTYIPPPDGVWGVLKEDGTWNGMMNLIQKEEVDFGEHIIIN